MGKNILIRCPAEPQGHKPGASRKKFKASFGIEKAPTKIKF